MGIPVSRFLTEQKVFESPDRPTKPLVSVCMPTYRNRDGGATLRAIESVLGQTFTDFEFIIVDDGSLDGLHSFLLEYQQSDHRIVVIRHEENSGLPALRVNEAILASRGQFIAYMFEDDEWYEEALEKLVRIAQDASEECVVYGAVEWRIQRSNGIEDQGVLGKWDFDYAGLKDSNKLANCAVLHSRSILDSCGMYDPHILVRRLSDYDMWLRLGRKVPFYRCPHVIGKVTSGTRYSLGATVVQNLGVVSQYMQANRDKDLRPESFSSFVVDNLDFSFSSVERHRIQEEFIIPFWQQHSRLLKPNEQKSILVSTAFPSRALVTKANYSTSVDVTIGNFNELLRKELSFSFWQEGALYSEIIDDFDFLVLYRTIGYSSLTLLKAAQRKNKPVVYLMDDNMFKFGTGYLGEEFPYLKPGTNGRKILDKEIEEADAVISYSPAISNDVSSLNPRCFELSTNIREHFIVDAEPPEHAGANERIKFAILTGTARYKELQFLSPLLKEFSNRHSSKIEFHIWGVPASIFNGEEFACPTYYKPFNNSYEMYLRDLQTEKFDFVICPLFDDHDTKKSKSPVKYLEATAAGAIGIFSDIGPYKAVTHEVTGIKVENVAEAWEEALEMSMALSEAERKSIYAAARDHVLSRFTTETQFLKFNSAFEAAILHASLKSRTALEKKSAIAYFFHETALGGATMHLMRHALILQGYGFSPIFCIRSGEQKLDPDFEKFASDHGIPIMQLDFNCSVSPKVLSMHDMEKGEEIAEWFADNDIRFVHAITFIAPVFFAAKKNNIPCLATLHQYYEPAANHRASAAEAYCTPTVIHSSSNLYASKWRGVLGVPAFTIRAPISDTHFERPLAKGRANASVSILVSGTIQPRKGQLEAIKAIKLLKDLDVRLVCLGYSDKAEEYVRQCFDLVEETGLGDRVEFPGFVADPQRYYESADYILCASDDESMPQAILKAMASGIPVVTTPVGGVEELVVDGFSGVVARGCTAEDIAEALHHAIRLPDYQREKMLENARQAASMACSEEVVAYKLLNLYNRTVKESSKRSPLTSEMPTEFNLLPTAGQQLEARLINRFIEYKLRIPYDGWCGVTLTFGTYFSHLSGRLVGTISLQSTKEQIRQFSLNLEEISDNEPITLTFPPISDSKDREFVIRLAPQRQEKSMRLAVYEWTSPLKWSVLQPSAGTQGELPIKDVLISRASKRLHFALRKNNPKGENLAGSLLFDSKRKKEANKDSFGR